MSKRPSFTVEATSLRTALRTACVFASTDLSDLPCLNAVLITPHGEDGVEVVACDRYVMSWEALKVDGTPFPVLIPLAIARRILDLLPGRGPGVTAAAHFATRKDGRVRVVLPGDHDPDLTFAPCDGPGFPDHRYLADRAAGRPAEDRPTGVRIDARKLAPIVRAIAERGGEPMDLNFTGPTSPVLITTETLGAMIAPIRKGADR